MNKPTNGKNPLIYIALLIVGLIAGGLLVYLLQGNDKKVEPTAMTASREQTTTERKVKYWQAPMNPNYIRNEPGKSPMGMDLIPVYEDSSDSSEAGLVSIDPVTIQNIGVRTAIAKKTRLTKTIATVGKVDYDEKRVHHVNTKVEGWINKLFVDFTGKKVNKNDYLLELYSPKLVTTQEEYLLAKSYQQESGEDSSVLDLARKRLEFLDVPAHQIKELEQSGEIKKYIHIHSPATGVVVEKNVSEGMFIKPGTALYTIADLSRVWVYADVYEYELGWIEVGQDAEITLEAHPGEVFKGKVTFINPFMESGTRTNKVRLEFANPDGRLKPKIFANVTLKSRRKKTTVVVPTEAVLLSGERNVVIIARGNGKFTAREVTLGIEADDHYEILEGLFEGEEVVTSAQFLIDSESRLREAISKMLSTRQQKLDPAWIKHEKLEHKNMDDDELTEHIKTHKTNGHDESHHDDPNHKEMPEINHKGMNHDGMPKMNHKEMNHEGSAQ